jgi:hypothetical protein
MLHHGADIRFVQQLLGHADLETTAIYTQVSIEQLQRVHALTHPGASLHFKPVENPLAHGLRVSAGTAQAAGPVVAPEIEGMLEDEVEDDDA